MAERRMMSKKVIHSDDFMDLPATTKNLYFYLMIEADDDGFVNSPKRISRMIGSTDDDAKLLIAKKFIISFESGIIVVKHWRMHNYIRSDRYKETSHLKEKKELTLKDNGIYSLGTVGIPSGSIGKVRLGEVRLGKSSKKEYKSDKDFSLPSNKFIDDCTDDYLKNLEEYLKDHIETLSLVRIKANSPLGEPMDFEDFLLALRSSGKKYKNYVATYKTWERRKSERLPKNS